MTTSSAANDALPERPPPTALVVDVANVMGSRPDGWWRDRAAAASRLVGEVAALRGRSVQGPSGGWILVERLFAVVEGKARMIPEVAGVELIRADGDGDDALHAACVQLVTTGAKPLAVTADRQLRDRLPAGTSVAGPGWLLRLL